VEHLTEASQLPFVDYCCDFFEDFIRPPLEVPISLDYGSTACGYSHPVIRLIEDIEEFFHGDHAENVPFERVEDLEKVSSIDSSDREYGQLFDNILLRYLGGVQLLFGPDFLDSHQDIF